MKKIKFSFKLIISVNKCIFGNKKMKKARTFISSIDNF